MAMSPHPFFFPLSLWLTLPLFHPPPSPLVLQLFVGHFAHRLFPPSLPPPFFYYGVQFLSLSQQNRTQWGGNKRCVKRDDIERVHKRREAGDRGFGTTFTVTITTITTITTPLLVDARLLVCTSRACAEASTDTNSNRRPID